MRLRCDRGGWRLRRDRRRRPHDVFFTDLTPEEGFFLAGSDVASGRHGFVDGAIESGLSASLKVIDALRS